MAAQSVRQDQAAETTPAILPVNLASITTDTGAFAPGRRDFSHYGAPGLCLAAATATRDLARRSLDVQAARDTLRDVREDTVGIRAAIAVARRCDTGFLTADAPARDLAPLFQTALLLHDDTLAQALLTRELGQAPTAAAQSALRLKALTAMLGLNDSPRQSRLTQPPLMQAAEAVISDLDRDPSLATRVQMRLRLMRYWGWRDSLVAVQHEADAMLALFRQAPAGTLGSAEDRYDRQVAYEALMRVALFTQPDAIPRIAARAQQDSARLFDDARRRWIHADQQSIHDLIDLLSPIGAAWDPHQRQPAPKVQATFWYPTGADTVQPVHGKVTLLIQGGGASVASRVRRWLTKYGEQGLAITVFDVTDDTAAYWSPGDIDWTNGPFLPAVRGERLRWYYRDYEGLPVTVAIQSRHVQFQPWPSDRRTVLVPSQFEQLLANGSHVRAGDLLLTDRHGLILYQGNALEVPEWFDELMAWAVRQSPVPAIASPDRTAQAPATVLSLFSSNASARTRP